MKRVVVTGGAGFVGSHLCERLASQCAEVVSLDNYSTGTERNHVRGVTYIRGECFDIIDKLQAFKPDIVFHLGEYSRVEQSVHEPFIALRNTYASLPSVIQYAVEAGAKLVYSGSSTKFGDASSPYSIAKGLNTELVSKFCAGKIPWATTYFYNVYGGNELSSGPYATVVAKFLALKRNNQTALITSPGTQRRNFTHIDDIVDGLLLVGIHGAGDGYGIGADESHSIIELAKMVGVNYKMRGESPGNRQFSGLYTDQTKQLGWSPRITLPQYIKEQTNA